jgi:ribosomal protein L32
MLKFALRFANSVSRCMKNMHHPPAPMLAVAGIPHQAHEIPKQTGFSLSDLMGLVFMAVPKKKSSLARRGARNASKYIRWDHSIHMCPKCGLPRRPHTYCEKFNCARKDTEEIPKEP